jgi:hypothetical protein
MSESFEGSKPINLQPIRKLKGLHWESSQWRQRILLKARKRKEMTYNQHYIINLVFSMMPILSNWNLDKKQYLVRSI